MKTRTILFTFILMFASTISVGQTQSVVTVNSNNISFASDSAFRITPSRVYATLTIDNSAEDQANAISAHLELQQSLFLILDDFGAFYTGQTEQEFETETSTSFIRKTKSFRITSQIEVTLLTDEQISMVAELIDARDSISLAGYSSEYKEEDSLESIQKRVINHLIQEAQEYQNSNNTTLTPRGISKMDIESASFGEETLERLIQDNRIDDELTTSAESIQITGIDYQVSAELLFR